MAEVVLRKQLADAGLADRVEVASAGTGDWHVGQGIDERAGAALDRAGYSHQHTARQFTSDDFDRFDMIIGLDRDNVYALQRLAPDAAARAKVRQLADVGVQDPYYGDDATFDQTLAVIEKGCEAQVDELRAHLDGAG